MSGLLQTLTSILGEHLLAINHEVLISYPHHKNNFKTEWIETLLKCSDFDLWKIDSCRDYSALEMQSTLCECLVTLDQLYLPFKKASATLNRVPLKSDEVGKIKTKKREELETLLPLLANEMKKNGLTKLIDLGGGMGHTSRIFQERYQIATCCIDADEFLIAQGKKKFPNSPPFIHHHFKENSLKELSFSNYKDSLFLGLHACGNLSNILIKESVREKIPVIVSLGCCYQRLQENEFPISKRCEEFGKKLSHHALYLATRSHAPVSKEEYDYKYLVKQYRYAFHLFLYHYLGITEFQTLGDGKPALYSKPFSYYANKKLAELSLKKCDEKKLDQFFYDQKPLIKEMYIADILRWKFGRAIELFILLDRHFYLEESGYEAALLPLFDEAISPRNIAVIGKKNH